MARSLGLPARVAVGFTPGDTDQINPGVYHVRGLHAHAWPEVFIPHAGLGACSSRRQDAVRRTPSSTRVFRNRRRRPAWASTTLTTDPPRVVTPTSSPGKLGTGTTLPNGEVNADDGTTNKKAEPAFWSTQRFGGKAVISLGILLALGALYVVAVLSFYAFYRWRRREAAARRRRFESASRGRRASRRSRCSASHQRDRRPRSEFGVPRGQHQRGRWRVGSSRGFSCSRATRPAGATDDGSRPGVRAQAGRVRLGEGRSHQRALVVRSASSTLDPPERRRPVSRRGPSSRKRGDAPLIEILRLE